MTRDDAGTVTGFLFSGQDITENLKAREEQAWAIDAQPPEAGLGPWEHIGSCSFFQLNWRSRQAEAGILIGAREYWGQLFSCPKLAVS